MRNLLLSILVAAAVVAISCSSGSNLPKPGTPGYYWSEARTAYKAGDFVRTDELLQRIIVSDNEFTSQARTWDIVVSAGLAQGYSALADVYELGARNNRQNPTPYHRSVSELRGTGGVMVLQVADGLHKFRDAGKDAQVLLPFGFPAGSAVEPAGLKRIGGGVFVPDSERELLQKAMLQRGVLLATCAAAGNSDDAAKTLELFKAPEVRVPRNTFLFATAKMLQERSDIFGGNKLDQPLKLKAASQEALESLKAVPQTKETKGLAEKIQKALKKAKVSI